MSANCTQQNDLTTHTMTQRRPRRSMAIVAVAAVVLLGFSATACTPEEVAQVVIHENFDADQRACALRIVKRESNFQADVYSPNGNNVGLFQINAVHKPWIAATFGYDYHELTSSSKNAEVARAISDLAVMYWGDPWQPWRLDGKPRRDGSCAA